MNLHLSERTRRRLHNYIPISVSAILIIVLVAYTPWPEVISTFANLNLIAIAILIGLSISYYALKALRFWYMLKAMKIRQPLPLVALSYMTAQPVTLLPAGEIFRSHALERHTGVPAKESLPQFTMQGLLEGAGMTVVGVICALMLNELWIPVLILASAVVATFVGIQAGLMKPTLGLFNRIPFINVSAERLERFSRDNKVMLSWRWFPLLLSISVAVEVVGSAVAYVAVTGLAGDISVFQAGLVYILPTVAGFVSFLPGGLGVSEQSSVGILLLSGTGVAVAVASTLLVRVTLVGGGVVYGVIAMGVSRLHLGRLSSTTKK